MKLKPVLFSLMVLSALLMSAFGSHSIPQAAQQQATPTAPAATVVPAVTVVPATLVAVGTPLVATPGLIPVTGTNNTGLWTIVLFGLLALLGIAFLVALFSPRTANGPTDRNPPPPEA